MKYLVVNHQVNKGGKTYKPGEVIELEPEKVLYLEKKGIVLIPAEEVPTEDVVIPEIVSVEEIPEQTEIPEITEIKEEPKSINKKVSKNV
jgi:hypothetical protein